MGWIDSILGNDKFKQMAFSQLAKVFDSGKVECIVITKDAVAGELDIKLFEPGDVYQMTGDKEAEIPEGVKIILTLKFNEDANLANADNAEPE